MKNSQKRIKILCKILKPSEKEIVNILLKNRGIKTIRGKEEFLSPKMSEVTAKKAGIDQIAIKTAVKRIRKAIREKEEIVVFGDYDVDGICGTAILWETLNSLGAKVMPYIPHRIDEGYGLSIKGINSLRAQKLNPKLIITVDNGVVANKAVEYAKETGSDVIITDHHTFEGKRPKALSIIHSEKLCGAGVALMLSKEIGDTDPSHLELAAVATVADLVPLTGISRTITKFGLEKLKKTKRLGFLEIFKEAALDPFLIGTYEVGHIIAPRINAMGRLEYAMDSLRLICGKNKEKVRELARKLSETNKRRQSLTEETTLEAISKARVKIGGKKLVFLESETFQQGVIGLVAGKLVEEFYLPSIVVSRGEVFSKASARSISGFNIIDFIRSASDILIDAGGHPMAAGFTVETGKLGILKKRLEVLANKKVTADLLVKEIKVDCEIPLSLVGSHLYEELEKMEPFGIGNPIPTFLSKAVIEDIRLVGNGNKHAKIRFGSHSLTSRSEVSIIGIWFNFNKDLKINIGDKANIVYAINQNKWNGNINIELKLKDIRSYST